MMMLCNLSLNFERVPFEKFQEISHSKLFQSIIKSFPEECN